MENKIDFIGIGFEKCGSTWISKCLQKHPQVLFSAQKTRKEIAFFSEKNTKKRIKRNIAANWEKESNYNKGIDWYLKQFPAAQKKKIRGEFSPGYIRSKKALKRIKKHFPDAKIIIAIRNPIDMLYSLYWYRKQSVRVRVDYEFNQAVKNDEWKKLNAKKGKYYKHLKNAFDIFPQKNIYIVFFDDIKNKPKKVVREMYEFLKIDTNFVPSVIHKKVNPSKQIQHPKIKSFLYKIAKWMSDRKNTLLPDFIDWLFEKKRLYKIYQKIITFPKTKATGYPKMQKETRIKLINYYHKDVEKMVSLINKDLSRWLSF